MEDTRKHDLVIVGAGPAGLTAAIYATRSLLDTVVLEQTTIGGQVVQTNDIDNYPGVPNTTGFELMDLMSKQAKDLGAKLEVDPLLSISHDEKSGTFALTTGSGSYEARSVIYAGGANPRRAGFVGEDQYAGKGVSYCATCDGMFYRGKQVFVIGGGTSAAAEALFLTHFASKVTILVRKDHMRAQAALVEELNNNEKVEIRYRTTVQAVSGGDLLQSITLRNEDTLKETTETFAEGTFGVFVFVGYNPASQVLGDLVERTPGGAIITDDRMRTKTDGLFVAGDVRDTPLRQIVTAAADGALAATSAASYLGRPLEG